MRITTILLASAISSCSNADGGSAGETSTATTADGCSPGVEGCPCHESGLCIAGLVCLSNLCVEPGDSMTSSTSGTTSSTGTSAASTSSGSSSTTDSGFCASNLDCAEDSVCYQNYCLTPDYLKFRVAVESFIPPMCTGDIYYMASGYASEVSTCPAAWFGEGFEIRGFDALEMTFYDNLTDNILATICWQPDQEGICGVAPWQVFHDGGYTGSTGDGLFQFSIKTQPIAECPLLDCF